MSRLERSHLRVVRDPEPLGSYIRPLHRDYSYSARLLAAGHRVGTGFVVDACDIPRSEDLRQLASERGLEVVLDPRSIELSTAGGIRRSGVLQLPWSAGRIDRPEDFSAARRRDTASSIADTALEMGVSAILAPTHFLDSFPGRWFDIDLELASQVRAQLDRDSRGQRVRVYYPLASSLGVLAPEAVQQRVSEQLGELARSGVVDAVWLRMHGFGTTSSGPLNIRRYVRIARGLHTLGVPVVGERTGTVGVALLAFGCVSAIESSVTHGERCDIRSLQKVPKEGAGGFSPAPRVYLPSIGAFLDRELAAEFLNHRSVKNWFACQGSCCRRGVIDMLAEPRRHFLVSRAAEVAAFERTPQEARVEQYFSSWLRPASDRAIRAARVLEALGRHRERLDQWRETFSEIRERDAAKRPTVSVPLRGPYRIDRKVVGGGH